MKVQSLAHTGVSTSSCLSFDAVEWFFVKVGPPPSFSIFSFFFFTMSSSSSGTGRPSSGNNVCFDTASSLLHHDQQYSTFPLFELCIFAYNNSGSALTIVFLSPHHHHPRASNLRSTGWTPSLSLLSCSQ